MIQRDLDAPHIPTQQSKALKEAELVAAKETIFYGFLPTVARTTQTNQVGWIVGVW